MRVEDLRLVEFDGCAGLDAQSPSHRAIAGPRGHALDGELVRIELAAGAGDADAPLGAVAHQHRVERGYGSQLHA